MNRIPIVILIVLAAVAALALGYFLSIPRIAPVVPGTTPGGGLPPVGVSSGTRPSTITPTIGSSTETLTNQNLSLLKVVGSEPVVGYYADDHGTIVVVGPMGSVSKVSGGTTLSFSPATTTAVTDTSFSDDGSELLVAFGQPAAREYSVFDVQNKKWTRLAPQIRSASWSSSSSSLVYLFDDGSALDLATLDVSRQEQKPKTIARLHVQDVEVLRSSTSAVLLADRGSALALGSLWSFDVKKGALAPLVLNRGGFSVSWDRVSNRGLLLSRDPNGTQELALINGVGDVVRRFSFLTIPSKCVFAAPARTPPLATTSSEQLATTAGDLYCAVPADQERLKASTLPDDYNKRALSLSDNIYRVKLSDGTLEALFDGAGTSIDAQNLSAVGNALYFINRYDGRLYLLPLAR